MDSIGRWGPNARANPSKVRRVLNQGLLRYRRASTRVSYGSTSQCELQVLLQGGFPSRVSDFGGIINIIYNFTQGILRFTSPTTHGWKQEKIPQRTGTSEPDFEFRA
jgi:hypothetical protein